MLPSLHQSSAHSLCLEAFVAHLKACTKRKDLETGFKLHAIYEGNDAARADPFIGSLLVDLYVKCGSFREARETFCRLSAKSVFTWNSLILGYTEKREYIEVCKLFDQMNLQAICPDCVTFVCILKACGQIRDLKRGKELHARVVVDEVFRRNVLVGSALVDMHTKWGLLIEAQTVFDSLPIRDVVTWTSLIGGYADHRYYTSALLCFQQMHVDGIIPDAWTYVCSVKACTGIGIDAINEAQAIYSEICRNDFLEGNSFICSSLIDMYAKCGLLRRSQEVFNKTRVRNVILWTAFISGYVENGHSEKALKCFEKMVTEGIPPNAVTYVSILKACSSTLGAVMKGQETHQELECKGLVEEEPAIANALVGFYARHGFLNDAQLVFNSISKKDTASWNVLIAGYCENGHGEEALELYKWMQSEGFSPDIVTYASLLKACGAIQAIDTGKAIHAEISRSGLLETDLVIGNTLVDMYVKCGHVEKAQEVFIELSTKDVVTWTTLIGGWVNSGRSDRALKLLEMMQLQSISPNLITLLCGLKACSDIGDPNKGREILAEAGMEREFVGGDVHVNISNSLVDMYAKCGFLVEAQQAFNKLQIRDVVTWNTLISGYSDQEQGEEAIKRFDQMRMEGVSPDSTTLLGGLKACCLLGTLHRGSDMHSEIVKRGLLKEDSNLGNALVDMYAKCGSIAASRDVFDKLQARDLVSWNSLIGGYARSGESEKVFEIFQCILAGGIKPGMITYILVLNACSRNGLIRRSCTFFEGMSRNHGMVPVLEHFACIVDLLGRAGQLCEAAATIRNSSFCASLVPWIALLGACRKWGHAKLGKEAFEHVAALRSRLGPAS